MVIKNRNISVDLSTIKKLQSCKIVFLKYHPEYKFQKLSNRFMIDWIVGKYMEGEEINDH